MTDFTFPNHWSKALETLDLSPGDATSPAGEQEDWAEVLKHFSTRGFLMFYLRPQAQGVSTRLDFALPQAERSASFGRELAARLRVLGARDAELSTEGPPAVVKAGFGDLDEDRAQTILTLFLKVRDFVARLENDPTAPSPLEQVDAYPERDAPDAEGETTFALATEEDEKGSDKREDPEPEVKRTAPKGGGFETIGKSAPAPAKETRASDAGSDSDEDGPLKIVASDVFISRGAVHVALAMSSFPGATRYDLIHSALRKTMRTNYDAHVEPTQEIEHNLDISGDRLICFILQPAITTAKDEDVRALRDDIGAYADRLVGFGEMNVSLDSILNLPSARSVPSRREERRDDRRDDRREARRDDEPSGFILDLGSSDSSRDEAPRQSRSEEQDRRNAPRDEEPSGMTLGFGGDAGESVGGKDILRAGNFEDARLKREDATSALVDVVLRHPGYSDKNICQVLTILLSIDYSKAMATIQQAPCVIAWGIGQERALTFKNVIEGAGGKVLLVEPGTFGNA